MTSSWRRPPRQLTESSASSDKLSAPMIAFSCVLMGRNSNSRQFWLTDCL